MKADYYPFGLKYKGYNNVTSSNGNSAAQKKKFAGEEFEDELRKNTVAYQWRDYDPALGRFSKIDRFAEKYYAITPYHFAANNPIFFKEIKGDSIQGVSRKSARKTRRIIRKTFRKNKKLARLFKTKGKKFKGVSQKDFDEATKNSSDDEKALAKGYFDAVNSGEIHTVEAIRRGKKLKSGLSTVFGDKNGKDVEKSGGGFNYKTATGSHSLIVVNPKVELDFVNNSTGSVFQDKVQAGDLLAHELLGHGLTNYNTAGNQFLNAIQVSNLYLRVVNGGPKVYDNGAAHGNNTFGPWGTPIPGTISWQIPLYLK